MDDDVRSVILPAVGAVLVLIALFLPLFTVHYSPPGGSAVLYGHQVEAFTDSISGWSFANAARWTHLLWVVGILALPLVVLILQAAEAEAGTFIAKLVHSLFHVVVAFGWLIVLGFGIIAGTVVMPYSGEKGILPEFQQSPFTPGYQQSLPNSAGTPHMSASLGIGWFLLVAGIGLGIIGLWWQVILVTVIAILTLILTHFFAAGVFHWIITWLL
jgi:hypothetical protein